MEMISRYFRVLWTDFGQIARSMDQETMAVLSLIVVVAGWLFLRGNLLRST